MDTNGTSLRLKHIALLVLFFVSIASAASAQPRSETKPNLEAALRPDMTDWITDSTGPAVKRRSDSLLNGALIGAGAAVASGLFLCRAMEPWDVCLGRDNAGPMIAIGAVGAGIGIGIDALIRGRKTNQDASGPPTRLYAAPIVARRAAGLHLSVSF